MFEHSRYMQTMKILENTLDTCMLRQRIIADNIANVNTPGFKKSYVSFEDELSQALQKKPIPFFRPIITDPRHIQFYKPPKNPAEVRPKLHIEYDTFFRNDKNNVDINIQMTNLAKNFIMYSAISKRISGLFHSLEMVIRGERY